MTVRRMLKFPVPFASNTMHDVPVSWVKLCALQEGVPTLWFECDDRLKRCNVTFRVFATGEAVPGDWDHYGSAVDGAYVWHIYGKRHA
jgi:hypothetical protein